MSNSYQYPQLNYDGIIDNDTNAAIDIFETLGTTQKIYIERGSLSVFKAAVGGGGHLEIMDTAGEVYFSSDVDEVKNIPINWGDEGRQIAEGEGVQVVLSGAATEQASVHVALTGHYRVR